MFASLVKQIGAKPAKARNEVGEIHFVVLFQPFFQVGRHHGFHDLIYPLEGRRRRLDGNGHDENGNGSKSDQNQITAVPCALREGASVMALPDRDVAANQERHLPWSHVSNIKRDSRWSNCWW